MEGDGAQQSFANQEGSWVGEYKITALEQRISILEGQVQQLTASSLELSRGQSRDVSSSLATEIGNVVSKAKNELFAFLSSQIQATLREITGVKEEVRLAGMPT